MALIGAIECLIIIVLYSNGNNAVSNNGKVRTSIKQQVPVIICIIKNEIVY